MQKYGELLRTLLEKRSITDSAQAEIFLNPDYERDFHDPFLMKDMERACVRIFEAVDNNKKIVIYADYDCDGIPGAVILKDLFKKLRYENYEVYIPQRNSEGYGLNIDKIKKGAEKWMLDMAGVATLSDMVPLLGENRAISYFGMKVLKKSPRPGLRKLLAKMNIDQRHLSEDDVGFMVTPRLNAASRMDDPMRAFELLSTENEM